MEKGFDEVKNILEKYQINRYWNLTPKYYDAYINKICGDYLYESGIAFKNSRFSWIKNFFIHSMFIIIGAIISKGKAFVKRIPSGGSACSTNIIAMPFCGKYAFFKRLPHLINYPIRVVYSPLFHYDYYEKHINDYSSSCTPEFYSFRIKDILKSLCLLLVNSIKLSKCSKELDNVFGVYQGKFSRIFYFPLLYGGFIKKVIYSQNSHPEKIIWIFDYDFDYKYIIYNNYIHKLRKDDETLHIQHGSFIKEVTHYCCPVSDHSLCCSIREKSIIEKFNPFNSQIHVLGAPLQTFDDEDSFQKILPVYDILFLLTDAYGKIIGESQKYVLRNTDGRKYRIKLRYRPASKDRDKEYFKGVVDDMEESIGCSLLQDVTMSKMIICFSEDALYTAIRLNKPIVYIRDEDINKYYNLTHKSRFFHIIKPKDFLSINIDDMINYYQDCDYSKDSHIIENFGYFKLSDVQLQINNILSELLA